MSETKHTPGPWTLDGEYIEALDGDARIAELIEWTDEEQSEQDANGRLIIAAPYLLFALKQIVADLPANRDWLNPDIERLARAAIAKAEGG